MNGPSDVGVLSISKLRVGQEAYQLSGVAQSLDAYYTGAGEADGVWVGGSAAALGLEGVVQPDDLRAVLAGLAPGTGGLTPNGETLRTHPRRVPGFDLTFKAPKSASVLYAVTDDPRVQGAVIEAGETAMRAAVGWLEREAIRANRGSHNQAWLARHADEPGVGPHRIDTSGVVAAAFRHRTSRAGDPLLHWHVLVANLVEGTDGKWSAFAHPELYRHARAAGELFQTVYRDTLSQSLGVEWRPGRHVPEIAGIPQPIIDMFSKRTREIDAWLTATGTPDTPEGRQAAVLATRRHKPEVEDRALDDGWKLEAIAAGWGPAEAEQLLTRTVNHTHGHTHGEHIDVDDDWIDRLLRSELTAHDTTFTTADLIEAIARDLGEGAAVAEVERLAHLVLASDEVIRVNAPDRPPSFTSRELLDIEGRFITALTTTDTHPVAGEADVAVVCAGRPTLGDDQRAAVVTIATGSGRVAVLVGPAGTGKTFTIDAIRDVFERAGWTVTGAAPSARAAIELANGAHIPSSTLHSLLNTWDRDHDTPHPRSLLVIDESGMADLRTLEATVTRQLAGGGGVLLAGDHHQLPEIGAGGGFEYATAHSTTVTELTVNRRQRATWEHTALAHLRNGSIAIAVDSYLTHRRVVATETPNDMITTATRRWADARATGLNPVLLAGTNDLVDRLNGAAVAHLIETGELVDDPVVFGSGSFRTGERVVLRRNSTERTTTGEQLDVANGQTGTITHIGDGEVCVRLDNTVDPVVLTDRYLQRGGTITHAYALTTHRAQGGTWDLAIAVGADGLYREGAYVELSRGIHENWIVLTQPEATELRRQALTETERHDTGLTPPDEHRDLDDDLAQRISHSHAKDLAHTLDPDVALVDHLARTTPLTDLERHLDAAHTATRIATDTLGYDGRDLRTQLDRIDHVARHITVGMPVSPIDRHNIGKISALDDCAGTATVQFTSVHGGQATRTFAWHELRLIGDPDPRPLTDDATVRLHAIHADFDARIEAWQDTVRTHGVEPDDTRRYQRAVEQHIDRATSRLIADNPTWLTQLTGARPLDPAGAHTWDDTVRTITTWRARHDLGPDIDGIGTRPDDGTRADWDALSGRLGVTRLWLASSGRLQPLPLTERNYYDLIDRRAELDLILDTAPADWRDTIRQLQDGQLTLDDTTDLLTTALTGQHDRQTWIIEHWPHIVEYHEIDRALDHDINHDRDDLGIDI